MKKLIGLQIFFTAFASMLMAQQNRVDMVTELRRLTSFHELPAYQSDTRLYQVSSYDTTGNNDDGFSGKYSFIRRNPDSSLVIFEAKGKGVINRIWTPTPTQDTLDFYFGENTRPSFSICFADLFSGKVHPFVAPLTGNEVGGYYCYVPIPFAAGCRIVSRGKKIQFYQVQHRTYPSNYAVTDFNPELNIEASQILEELVKKWSNPQDIIQGKEAIHRDTVLSVGGSITLAHLKKGGRIVGLTLSPVEAFRGLHKQIDLKITWDGERTPAIYMPVADFFGYAFGYESMQSLLLGAKNGMNYSFLPMPFAKEAKIELIYRAPDTGVKMEAVRIKANVYYTNEKLNPRQEGKLYAYWHANMHAPLGEPHVFLSGKGRGHYVGTILQAQGLQPGMTLFFEGDDVTTMDGEMRLHGTGSEDYFNGGWYALLDRWDRKMSLPLHGSLDYSLPYARTGGYRLFISDKMPFNQEIQHTIEHGPEKNNKPVDYTSVAFYYADKAVSTDQAIPNNTETAVFIPDTLMIYPQLMKYSLAGAVHIAGNTWTSENGGQIRIDLSDLPMGDYQLLADIEKGPQGAEVVWWQRQKQVSNPISFYSPKKQREPSVYICDIALNEFRNALTVHFKRDKERHSIQVSRLILIRKK